MLVGGYLTWLELHTRNREFLIRGKGVEGGWLVGGWIFRGSGWVRWMVEGRG